MGNRTNKNIKMLISTFKLYLSQGNYLRTSEKNESSILKVTIEFTKKRGKHIHQLGFSLLLKRSICMCPYIFLPFSSIR